MTVATVAIIKYDGTSNSLKRAIDLTNGFGKLKPSDKILIKPNIASGLSQKIPPNGITTTTVVVEHLISLLREYGCTGITIGEGPVLLPEVMDRLKSADWAFEWSGFRALAEKLDVKLIDFNRGGKESFASVDAEDLQPTSGVDIELIRNRQFKISRLALETDFFINVPVLKTHRQSVISMGLKNLKGCLYNDSKRACHVFGLHRPIAFYATKIKNDLIIIDGLYGIERGPIPSTRNDVHPLDLIITGTDILACDIVGSAVIGVDPESVGHLREFAQMTGSSLSLQGIEIKGEKIENVRRKLDWVLKWSDQPTYYGIKGFEFQDPGESVCTGCGMTVYEGMRRFFEENKQATFDHIEVCVGPGPKAKKESKKVLLFGDCAIATNKRCEDAIHLRGCPPSIERTYQLLRENAVKLST